MAYSDAYKIAVLKDAKKFGTIYAAKKHKLPPKTLLRWNDKFKVYEKQHMRKFTDEEKIKILEYANQYGMTSAQREFDIDVATQRSWNTIFKIYKKEGRRENATHVKKFERATLEFKKEVLNFAKQYGISKAVRKYNVPASSLQNWNRDLKVYAIRQFRKFTEEKKAEIMQYATETSLAEAAKKYDVGSSYIKKWIKDAEQKQE